MFKWLQPKPKLSIVLTEYLEVNKLAMNTVRLTRRAWEQMIKQIGDMPVNKVTAQMVELVQAFWLDETSRTTARIYRKTINPIFNWSVKKGYIKSNPFNGLKVPKEIKRQVRVYDPFELRRLMEACDDIRWLGVILIATSTGMRKSAIQNLHRDDISFETETINVQEKFETDSSWWWQTKDREDRKVPLAPQVANILTELLYAIPNSQPYVMLKPSRYYHLLELKKMGLLTDDMRLYPFTNFDRKFRKIKKKARVKGRFHDLRSTCLTDLASVLNPREVAAIGGHSDFKTTMRYIGTGRDTVDKARLKVTKTLEALIAPSHAL